MRLTTIVWSLGTFDVYLIVFISCDKMWYCYSSLNMSNKKAKWVLGSYNRTHWENCIMWIIVVFIQIYISNRKKLALWAFCPEFVKIRKCNHEGRRFPVSDKYFIVVFIPLEPKSCQKSDIHCKKCFIKVLMWKIKY